MNNKYRLKSLWNVRSHLSPHYTERLTSLFKLYKHMKSKELWNEQKGLFILHVFLIKFRSALHLWVVWACMLEWVAIIDFKKKCDISMNVNFFCFEKKVL